MNGTLTAASLVLSGGRISGDGTIDAPVIITGGTLEPGDPPGPITLLSLMEGPGATTQIDLLSALLFGQIIITGSGDNNVVLDGRLLVLLSSGAALSSGVFTILDDPNGTIFGNFTSGASGVLSNGLLYQESVSLDRHSVLLQLTAPEPTTWVLMTAGIGAMLRRRHSARKANRPHRFSV